MSALEEQKAEIYVQETAKDASQTNTAMKHDSVNSVRAESFVSNQNGTNGKDTDMVDLTKPIKTEAEASMNENSLISRSLQLTPSSSATISSPITPFAPNMGSLSSQLTPDEQTAAYKKANILALSALAKKGGPNTKEIFAAQQKLQEFLTSLITLAGQKGPQLKVTVQMLVQNLVSGQLSEEEFATRIESDLNSKHQPSLLPFLKESVPHLKARLQLQQVIMKELLQKLIAEKKNSTPPPMGGAQLSTSQGMSQQTLASGVPLSQALASGATMSQPVMAVQVGSVPTATQLSGNRGNKPTIISGSKVSVSNANSQVHLPQTFSQTAMENLGLQLPKGLRDKIAKLPKEQQKIVYMHQLRQVQQLKEKQQQHGASPKHVMEKQRQLVHEQQVPLVVGVTKTGQRNMSATVSVGGDAKSKSNFATMRIIAGGGSGSPASPSKRKGKGKESGGAEIEEDEEVGMDLLEEVGVNLHEETAQFLPRPLLDSGVSRSWKDTVFLNLPILRRKVEALMRVQGVRDVGEEALVLLSHATQERMRDVVEKLTEVSQHRIQVLKDDAKYRVGSEVKSQLRVLETIDRILHKRKQEKEHEQMLRAAKSRSKGADPEKTAKIREEAKQIQQDEAARIRNESANRTALAAIGRKRQFMEDSGGGGASSSSAGSFESGSNSAMTSSLFAPLASTRAPKRHVTSRDLIFYMEQERELRKSLTLYKSLMK